VKKKFISNECNLLVEDLENMRVSSLLSLVANRSLNLMDWRGDTMEQQ
jgi:hypothetical protein